MGTHYAHFDADLFLFLYVSDFMNGLSRGKIRLILFMLSRHN